MTSVSMGLCRLGYMLAVVIVTTVTLWPWLQGPALPAVAQLTGWTVSGVIADRVEGRSPAWKIAFAQGLLSALTVWLTLRWLHT